MCGVCALDHPFAVGRFRPVGAARLASTPSRGLPGLARDCRRPIRTGSPNLGGTLPTVSDRAGKIYQGSALPLSYGSGPLTSVNLYKGVARPATRLSLVRQQ